MKSRYLIAAVLWWLCGIWILAYGMSFIPVMHWARFPAILTGLAVPTFGAMLILRRGKQDDN